MFEMREAVCRVADPDADAAVVMAATQRPVWQRSFFVLVWLGHGALLAHPGTAVQGPANGGAQVD
jgi:hypothetical protein